MSLDTFAIEIEQLALHRPVHPDVCWKIASAAGAISARARRPGFVFVDEGAGRFLAGSVEQPRRIPQLTGCSNLEALHAVVSAGGAPVPLDRSARAKRLQLQGAADRIGGELGKELRDGIKVGKRSAWFDPVGVLHIRLR